MILCLIINIEIIRILLLCKIGSHGYRLGRSHSRECIKMINCIIEGKGIGLIGRKGKKGKEFKEKNSLKKDKLKYGLRSQLNQLKNHIIISHLKIKLSLKINQNPQKTRV